MLANGYSPLVLLREHAHNERLTTQALLPVACECERGVLTVSQVSGLHLADAVVHRIQAFVLRSGLDVQLGLPPSSHEVVYVGAGVAQSSLLTVRVEVLRVVFPVRIPHVGGAESRFGSRSFHAGTLGFGDCHFGVALPLRSLHPDEFATLGGRVGEQPERHSLCHFGT